MNGRSADQISKVLGPALPNFMDLVWISIGALVLIWVTFRVRAWFHDDDAGAGRNTDLLTDLRELHRQGGLSDEEFRLIKTRLVGPAASGKGSQPKPASSADGVVSALEAEVAGPDAPPPSLQGRSESPGQEVLGPGDQV